MNITKKMEEFENETHIRLRKWALGLMEEFEDYFFEKEGKTFKEYMEFGKPDGYLGFEETRNNLKNCEISQIKDIVEKVLRQLNTTITAMNVLWVLNEKVSFNEEEKEKYKKDHKIN